MTVGGYDNCKYVGIIIFYVNVIKCEHLCNKCVNMIKCKYMYVGMIIVCKCVSIW